MERQASVRIAIAILGDREFLQRLDAKKPKKTFRKRLVPDELQPPRSGFVQPGNADNLEESGSLRQLRPGLASLQVIYIP